MYIHRKKYSHKNVLLLSENLSLVEGIICRGSNSFQRNPLILPEAISLSENHSFLWNHFQSGRHFVRENCYFQWKPFLLVKPILAGPFFFEGTIYFSGSCLFLWKLCFLVEAVLFSGSHSCKRSLFFLLGLFLLVETVPVSRMQQVFRLVEEIPFIRNLSIQKNLFVLWKPFNGSCSSQQQLCILDSVLLFNESCSFQYRQRISKEFNSSHQNPYISVGAITFNESRYFFWKPLLLVETFSFSESRFLLGKSFFSV